MTEYYFRSAVLLPEAWVSTETSPSSTLIHYKRPNTDSKSAPQHPKQVTNTAQDFQYGDAVKALQTHPPYGLSSAASYFKFLTNRHME